MDELPNPLSNLSWKDDDIESSLRTLHQYVEAEAQRQIGWYYGKKKWKSRMSAALRLAAVLLFVAGGLVPIIKAIAPNQVAKLAYDLGQAGYLVIAIAAGCLALDKFFGYSTGWIRYITTALALEKSLEEYRMEWTRQMSMIRGGMPTAEQVEKLILTCEMFSMAIKSQVEQETKAWVAEFQSNLAQLEKELQATADEIKAKSAAAGGDGH